MKKRLRDRLQCPKCPSSDAYFIYDDGGYCFSCGYVEKKGYSELSKRNVYTQEFVPWCDISKETMIRYNCYSNIDATGKPVEIVFKHGDGLLIRNREEKKFQFDGQPTALFGQDRFDAGCSDAIVITEGAKDALSVYEIFRSQQPAVAVLSASTARNECVRSQDYLNAFNKIYICFDNDEPGKKAARAVATLFDASKVYILNLSLYKDANDYLTKKAVKEFKISFHNTKSYEPTKIISSFNEIKEALNEPGANVIATWPFPTWNDMTYGIRLGERILITAQEGIGKTEIVRAIEYHVCKTTDENIGVIHLEENKKRTIKGLAGYELKLPVHLPKINKTTDEIFEAYKNAVGREDKVHIYSHFGSDDPDIILNSVRKLATVHKCNMVFFDHITMAVSGLADEDERRALDQISTRLAMMTEELQFSLVFVSHVNDFGQTRGSRYISKICDLRIDLERNLDSENIVERNTTKTRIRKNRFSGLTGPSGNLWFDPDTYIISELQTETEHGFPV